MEMLKTISENNINTVLKLKVSVKSLEDAYRRYSNATLDVFNHTLSIEEANNLLGSFVDHNLKYECRYLQFIEAIHKLNNSMPVIVDIYLSDLDNIDILRILETLDYQDKLVFIDLIRHNKSKAHFFLIEDKKLLSLLVKLSTRELLFSIFHFTNAPITIVGNFDLSFPVFCSNESDLIEYSKIARKNDLYFRNINIK